MNLKFRLLSILMLTIPLYITAQTARNPLNFEPARVSLQKQISSWKMAEEIFYHADGKPFEKRSYQYDEHGRTAAELTLRWSEMDKTWLSKMQYEYEYKDNQVSVLEKSGSQYTSKTETVTDTKGKPARSVTFTWNRDIDDWSINPYLRCEWVYDPNGHLTTILKQYMTHNRQTFDARILYSYNEAGALNEELFQKWNPDNEQWENKGRYTYSNDGDHKKVATSYIYALDKWLFDGKTVYLYDAEGKITRCEYFKKNTDESFDAYSVINYSESACIPEVAESPEINIYPNPAVTSFELSVPSDYLGKIMYMFDGFGKQVKTVPIYNQKTQIDVSALPSGVYLIKIGDIPKRVIIK